MKNSSIVLALLFFLLFSMLGFYFGFLVLTPLVYFIILVSGIYRYRKKIQIELLSFSLPYMLIAMGIVIMLNASAFEYFRDEWGDLGIYLSQMFFVILPFVSMTFVSVRLHPVSKIYYSNVVVCACLMYVLYVFIVNGAFERRHDYWSFTMCVMVIILNLACVVWTSKFAVSRIRHNDKDSVR